MMMMEMALITMTKKMTTTEKTMERTTTMTVTNRRMITTPVSDGP